MKRPRILLSLDSSWWNRLRLSRFTYGRMLRRAGCETRSLRFREAVTRAGSVEAIDFERLLSGIDGLLLSGGGDVSASLYGADDRFHRGVDPQRDHLELALLDHADRRALPVLGICRGAQLMNIHRKGINRSLRPDPLLLRTHRRRQDHPVHLQEGSRLAAMFPEARGTFSVSTYHAHAVDRAGSGLRVAATAPDGVIEAIESEEPEPWRLGVQWHPEWRPRDRNQRLLFRGLRDAARQARQDSAATRSWS